MNESITYKDSYVMYKNWSKGILKLTDEQAGQLLKAICLFQNGEETEPEEIAASALFEIFKEKMIEDAEAYKAKVDKLKENFQKGNKNSQKEKEKDQKEKNKSQMGKEKDHLDVVATDTDTYTDTLTDTKDLKDIKVIKKESYGEMGNVKLTVKEREKLISEYGSELTEKAIDYLDGYIADKNYKSKSNYQAIRRWVIDAVKEKGNRASTDKFDLDAYLREQMEDTG